VSGAAALLEAGVRAYTRGALDEAERCWREALAADPADPRAREYLAHLARRPAGRRTAPTPPPVPAPQAPPAAQDAAPARGWDALPARATVAVAHAGGLDLAALRHGAAPSAGGAPLDAQIAASMRAARELFALGDFTGSLELVERILAADPGHPEALSYLRENEATLVAMYESKLGPLAAAPTVRVRAEEVLWLNLDQRAGFLLAQVDGTTSWEDLFALSGMPRLDAARILARLVEDGVIAAG
jgi:tetratricopeptide (TPR) repeat protein